MADPSDRDAEREAEEIDREMKLIKQGGGGTGESAPLRRLGYLALIVLVVVVVARLFFWN